MRTGASRELTIARRRDRFRHFLATLRPANPTR